jgi:hypothetical protein
VAEVATRPGGLTGRRANRRKALDQALLEARTGRQVLAAAAQFFRSTFVRADDETIRRVAMRLIEMTEREAGENRDDAAH